jgi:hypothetical protein
MEVSGKFEQRIPTWAQVCLLCGCLPVIVGCGGSPVSGGSPAAAVYPSVTGNWNFFLNAPANSVTIAPAAGGYLTNTNGSVSGILHFYDTICVPITQDFPVAGSVTQQGDLSLTSTAVAGPTLSLSGLSNSGYAPAQSPDIFIGNFSLTGWCGGDMSGTATGNIVQPLTGTFSGNFEFASGTTVAAAISSTQTGPNADGEYGISGPITFTGSQCFTTGSIASSVILGNYIAGTINTDQNGVMAFSGLISNSLGGTEPESVWLPFQVTSGACAGATGLATLTQ